MHSGQSYVALLDSYLSQYGDDGGDGHGDTPEAHQYTHTDSHFGLIPAHGIRTASPPSRLPRHAEDVDSFLQQKIVEQNCRRRRHQYV